MLVCGFITKQKTKGKFRRQRRAAFMYLVKLFIFVKLLSVCFAHFVHADEI